MRLSFLFLLMFSGMSSALAQGRFEVEADPIAYIFKGYSFHLGYQTGHWRFNAGTFAITQPDFFTSDDRYTVRNGGFGIKADYLFRESKGLFVGLQSDYGKDKVKFDQTGESQQHSGINLGVRTGYRFMFGKKEKDYRGLYLVPWVALIYTPDSPTLQFSHGQYDFGSWLIFPTVHLGYRF